MVELVLVLARDNIFVINLFDIYFLTSNSFIHSCVVRRTCGIEDGGEEVDGIVLT